MKLLTSLLILSCMVHAGNPFASGPTITTSALPNGTVTQVYNYQLAATGGKPPLQWSAQSLPAGISVTASGALIGTPQSAGTFWVNIQVIDKNRKKTAKSLLLTVNPAPTGPPPLVINPGPPPSGTVGKPYQWQIPIQGGVPPYTCTPDPGNNLAEFGLVLDPSCLLHGVPIKSGIVTF